jgi:hypothetical protein
VRNGQILSTREGTGNLSFSFERSAGLEVRRLIESRCETRRPCVGMMACVRMRTLLNGHCEAVSKCSIMLKRDRDFFGTKTGESPMDARLHRLSMSCIHIVFVRARLNLRLRISRRRSTETGRVVPGGSCVAWRRVFFQKLMLHTDCQRVAQALSCRSRYVGRMRYVSSQVR